MKINQSAYKVHIPTYQELAYEFIGGLLKKLCLLIKHNYIMQFFKPSFAQ
jgi:hypothetical protein